MIFFLLLVLMLVLLQQLFLSPRLPTANLLTETRQHKIHAYFMMLLNQFNGPLISNSLNIGCHENIRGIFYNDRSNGWMKYNNDWTATTNVYSNINKLTRRFRKLYRYGFQSFLICFDIDDVAYGLKHRFDSVKSFWVSKTVTIPLSMRNKLKTKIVFPFVSLTSFNLYPFHS